MRSEGERRARGAAAAGDTPVGHPERTCPSIPTSVPGGTLRNSSVAPSRKSARPVSASGSETTYGASSSSRTIVGLSARRSACAAPSPARALSSERVKTSTVRSVVGLSENESGREERNEERATAAPPLSAARRATAADAASSSSTRARARTRHSAAHTTHAPINPLRTPSSPQMNPIA